MSNGTSASAAYPFSPSTSGASGSANIGWIGHDPLAALLEQGGDGVRRPRRVARQAHDRPGLCAEQPVDGLGVLPGLLGHVTDGTHGVGERRWGMCWNDPRHTRKPEGNHLHVQHRIPAPRRRRRCRRPGRRRARRDGRSCRHRRDRVHHLHLHLPGLGARDIPVSITATLPAEAPAGLDAPAIPVLLNVTLPGDIVDAAKGLFGATTIGGFSNDMVATLDDPPPRTPPTCRCRTPASRRPRCRRPPTRRSRSTRRTRSPPRARSRPRPCRSTCRVRARTTSSCRRRSSSPPPSRAT